MDKLISQQAAIDKITKRLYETAFNNVGIKQNVDETLADVAENRLENWFNELPSIQLINTETGEKVVIQGSDWQVERMERDKSILMSLPSVQPDIIHCKDCKHSRFFDPCFYCYEMGGEIIVPENGFCFKAERRQDATD